MAYGQVKITVYNSQVFSDLANFPAYFDMSHLPATVFANALSTGLDINIRNAAGALLAREIVGYNNTTKTGQLWVRCALADAVDTELFLEYGNGATVANSTDVWSNGFVSVYHMSQNPETGGACILDSTANAHHGTPAGTMLAEDLVAGKLGNCLDFDGTDDKIAIPNIYADLGGATPGDGTISAWSWQDNGDGGASLSLFGSYEFMIYLEATGYISAYTPGNGYPFAPNQSTRLSPNFNNWNLFQFSWDYSAKTITTVANGTVLDNEVSVTTVGGFTNAAGVIGAYGGTCAHCKIDEVRIANVKRTTAWLQTEYANQNSPGTFYGIADYATDHSFVWAT